MQTKPLKAYFLAAIFIFFALSIPLQISYWYGHHLTNEVSVILTKLTWLNLLVMFQLTYLAIKTFNANLTKSSLTVLFVLTIGNNYAVGKDATLYSMTQSLLGSVAMIIILYSFSRSKIFKILSDYKLQWWRAAKRKRVTISVKMGVSQLHAEKWKTTDLSATGLFLKAEKGSLINHPKLKVGSHFPIYLNELQSPINVEVVRKQTDRNGKYGAGLGLRFINLQSHQKQILYQAMA